MTTATILVTNALRGLGMIESGAAPSSTELDDGLESLNDMLASWSTIEGLIHETTREDFTLTVGVSNYTIGSGATFNTIRPQKVVGAALINNDVTYRLRTIQHREVDWISTRQVNALPSRLYYRNEFPNGKIEFDYNPDIAYTLRLTTTKPLLSFPDLTTDVSYPPEYLRAIKKSLQLEIAPEYGMEPDPLLISVARIAIENLITQNTRILPLRTDPGLRDTERYNIYSDE